MPVSKTRNANWLIDWLIDWCCCRVRRQLTTPLCFSTATPSWRMWTSWTSSWGAVGLPTPPPLSTLTWRQLSRYSVIHAFIHPSIHFRQFPVLKDRRFQLLFRIVVIFISFVLMSIPTIFMSVTCTRTKLSCVYVTQWSCMFSAELLAPCMRSCFGCHWCTYPVLEWLAPCWLTVAWAHTMQHVVSNLTYTVVDLKWCQKPGRQ